MAGRNVFENNNQIADEDVEVLGDGPHIPLPELKEGYEYAITDLPSGRKAVVVVDPNEQVCTHGPDEQCILCKKAGKSCGCGPFQGCATCGRYQGDGLNSPESRTLRHQD